VADKVTTELQRINAKRMLYQFQPLPKLNLE